jgi:hypothetical protein
MLLSELVFRDSSDGESISETIRKIGNNKWRLYSGKGKNLGTFDSLDAAKKHEREVQYFKSKEE